MTKKILSVLLVLFTLVTFVPFVGSAASVDASTGLLTISNSTASSGDGWSWANNTLTLGSGEVKAIDFGDKISNIKIVLTEDVTLDSSAITYTPAITFAGEGTLDIDLGGHCFTLKSASTYAISVTGTLKLSNGAVKAENNATYGFDLYVKTGDLYVTDAELYCEYTGLKVNYYVNADNDWIGGNAYITNSVVSVNNTTNNRDMDAFSAEKTIEIKSSVITSIGTRCAITSSTDISITDSIVNATGGTGCIRALGALTIDNCNVTAQGVQETISSCYYVGTDKTDLSKFTVTNADIVAPENGTIAQGISVPPNQTDNIAYIVGIKDESGSFAEKVEIKAQNADKLPVADSGETDEPDTPVEPEIPLEQGIYPEIKDGKLIITVVTGAGYNRAALFNAENTATSACLMIVNDFTESGENCVWVFELTAPTAETSYIVKCRDAETNSYKNGFVSEAFTVTPDTTAIPSVSHEIINGKLIITAVTGTSIDRVALYGADGKCIKTVNTYTVDENGMYVWEFKFTAPTEETVYTVKGRDKETSSYKNGITFPAFTVIPEVVFENVTVDVRGDKVYVIATTVSDNYDRVAVVNPVDNSYVKYTRNYKVVDGKYEWTIFFDYVEGMENLTVKARDIRNNRYNNAQAVEITVEQPVEPVIDVTITDYDEENLLVTVTTVPDLYRVKIAYADDATSYIAYARNPVEKTDDAWVWEMVIAKPTDTTEYAVDIAYVKAYARYFTYVSYNVPKAGDVAPDSSLWNKVTDKTYVFSDGKVSMYVGDWVYYGKYGLTLVAKANASPIDAAAIEIYEAESDEVFASKTASDFRSVLNESVTKFEQVTVDEEYLGYIAYTSSYRCLVFQANGYKYFINYMPATDWYGIDGEAAFLAAVESIVVYEL